MARVGQPAREDALVERGGDHLMQDGGLQDVGVPSKLIVYKGFEGVGHGPSKPKSSRAVMQHNLDWFDKYMFGAGPSASSPDPRR